MKSNILFWFLIPGIAMLFTTACNRPPSRHEVSTIPVVTSPSTDSVVSQQANREAPRPAPASAQPAQTPQSTDLVGYINTIMTTAVAGRDPVADRKLLLKHNDETKEYAYNTNNPAYPFHGVTGISLRGTGANCSYNGTLVSPRIVVTAGHCWQTIGSKYYYQDGQGAGAEWRFLDRNGKLHIGEARYSRLLTNTITGRAIDTRMFVLTEPMPPSVEPALWGSSEMEAKAGGLRNLPRFVGGGAKKLWPQSPSSTNLASWFEGIHGGDSGSGSFTPIGTNLVYIGSFGGDVLAEGVNWRETAEWLCTNFGYKASIPMEVDVSGFR